MQELVQLGTHNLARRWVSGFLNHLRQNGNLAASAKLTGVPRQTVYNLRNADREFDAAVVEAQAEAKEWKAYTADAEMGRRGIDGDEEPVIFQGKRALEWVDEQGNPTPLSNTKGHLIPLTVRRKSDTCLLAYAKAHHSDYRDKRAVELSGPGGGPIEQDVRADIEHHADPGLAVILRTLEEVGAVPTGTSASVLEAAADEIHPHHAPPETNGVPPAEPA